MNQLFENCSGSINPPRVVATGLSSSPSVGSYTSGKGLPTRRSTSSGASRTAAEKDDLREPLPQLKAVRPGTFDAPAVLHGPEEQASHAALLAAGASSSQQEAAGSSPAAS